MNKETSSHVSTIAARIMRTAQAEPGEAISGSDFNKFLTDAKTLAGSCMSQDEHAGQVPKHEPTFIERLQIERAQLSGKLDALTLFLQRIEHANVTTQQKELLKRQFVAMSEYLVVLDERLTDLGIAARSAPVAEIPIGDEALCPHGQPGTVNCPAVGNEDDGA